MCTTKRRMEWEMKLKYELKIQHLLDLCACPVLTRNY